MIEPRRRADAHRAGTARRGSLVVVGTGIKLVGQTTLETLTCLQRAEKLFYLVTDRATEVWLKRLNPTATTLENCYDVGKPRPKSYREMADLIRAYDGAPLGK